MNTNETINPLTSLGPDAVEIPGFSLIREIGRGASSIVYLAEKLGDKPDEKPEHYALKVLKQRQNSTGYASLTQLRKEASALARIRHPSLVRIFEVGDSGGRPYLIMEYIEGESLASMIRNHPLTEQNIIALATKLASALHEVHKHNLAHCDLKPQNVLIDKSGVVRLIDFGLAAPIDQKKTSKEAFGTLIYSSPEQIGILDRPIDGRSDLYSLGVVLFEACTGVPPFETNDLGRLIQKQIFQKPLNVSEINSSISAGLGLIIDKLLSKEPDDRYQSAFSLIADLNRVQEINTILARGDKIPLGTSDSFFQVFEETDMVGRDQELKLLMSNWKRTKKGMGSLILVSGLPGSGKTRLIEEFCHLAFQGGARVLSGKCSPSSSTPFESIQNSITEALQKIERLAPAQKLQEEEEYRRAVGDLAPLLKKFNPALAKILKNSQEIEITQAKEQFYEALADLYIQLATRDKPLILAIHDIQWLDDGTYQVLKQLVLRSKNSPLLVVCSGRSDFGSIEGLNKFQKTFEEERIGHIQVNPFDIESTQQFISGYLGNSNVESSLVQQIHYRTEGNPFAIEQFLGALLNEGLLRPYWDRWTLDSDKLANLTLPANVTQIMVRRVDSLSPFTKRIMGIAAILGSRFRLDDLPAVAHATTTQINRAIEESTRGNLIELTPSGEYRFVHDTAQEFLLHQFDAPTLQLLHQTIAEYLDQYQLSPTTIIQTAQHYNHGQIEKNSLRVYEVNQQAAKRLIESYSEEEAYLYLKNAEKALQFLSKKEENLPIDRSAILTEFQTLMGELCIRIGRLDEGIGYLEAALQKLNLPIDRAKICARLTSAWLYNGSTQKSWEYTERAFREMGYPVPKKHLLNLFWALIQYLYQWVKRKAISSPLPDHQAADILANLGNSAKLFGFFQGKVQIAVNLALRTYHCVVALSQSKELVHFYMYHALFLSVLGFRQWNIQCIDQAASVAKKINDPIALARAEFYRAICLYIIGEDQEATKVCEKALIDHGRWSSGDDYVMLTVFHHLSYILRGKTKELSQLNQKTFAYFNRKSNENYKENEGFLLCFQFAGLAMEGRISEATELAKTIEGYFKGREEYLSQQFIRMFATGIYYLEQEEHGEKVDQLIEEHEKWGPHTTTDMIDVCSFYIPKAHLRLLQWMQSEPKKKPHRLKQLHQALGELKKVSRTPVMEAHRWIVLASYYCHLGHIRRTERILFKLEKLGYVLDSPWFLFECAKIRALIFRQIGNQPAAMSAAQNAFQIAYHEGWEKRSMLVRHLFGLQDVQRDSHSISSRFSSLAKSKADTFTARQAITLKRNMDALLELATASANVLDPTEQAQIALRETVRLLGAERALLFLCTDLKDDLRFETGLDRNGNELSDPGNYSRSIIKAVKIRREPVVFTGADQNTPLFSESIIAHDLRSIIAAPLLIKDRFLGVLYLDSRIAKGIFSEDDLGIIQVLGSHFAITIETSRTTQLELEKKTFQKDLELTRAVQALILPKFKDYSSEYVNMAAFLQPAAQVGGDWWWLDRRENGTIRILIGDVTGHGPGPAMVTAIIASSYKTIQAHQRDASIPQVLKTLDQVLVDLCGGNYWVTMSALEIHPLEAKVQWWSACAPPLFLMKKDGTIELLESDDDGPLKPIGANGLIVSKKEFPFEPREKLLLFTDGLFEFKHDDGEEFGLRRLKKMFSALPKNASIQAIRDLVHKKSNEIFQKGELQDDITFVGIERLDI